MQGLVTMLLICSATMSVLSLIYAVATPLLARRYSASSRYYAWLIIVIGLIIPFRPSFGGAIVNYDLPSETVSPIVQANNAVPIVTPSDMATLPAVAPSVSLWQIAALIWLIGIITFAVYHAIQHYRFTKMVKRWSEAVACKQALSILESIKSEMGITRQIGLYQCPGIGGPTLLGFANPRILLPQANLTPDELKFILIHELTHYKRGDLWYKCAVLIAAAIHWFNPIVYFLVKAIDAACELSCDAETVRDSDADARQQYGETIIGVVRYQSKLKTALSTNFYGGKQGMKNRISSIMDTDKKKTGAVILCCVLILTLGTGMAFAAQSPPKSNPFDGTVDAHLNATQIVEDTLMSYVDPTTGKTMYSGDDGKTWSEQNDAAYAAPVVEWWTYDEYKVWMDEQVAALQVLADDGVPDYYDDNDVLRDFTQADVDEFAANCNEILNRIKDGVKVSKTVDGLTGSMISSDPRNISTAHEGNGATGTAYVVEDNSWSGNNVVHNYDDYAQFGITYRDEKLYYNGEPVRCFDDWYSLGENMHAGRSFFDKDGTVDIFAERDFSQIVHNPDGSYDPSGKLVGVRASSQAEFDARDIDALFNPPLTSATTNVENTASYSATQASQQGSGNTTATNTVIVAQSADVAMPSEVGRSFEQIFEAYADYGITFDTNSKNGGLGNVYYNGQMVKRFVDVRPDGSVTSVSSADGGKLTVRTVYDEHGNLTGLGVTEE